MSSTSQIYTTERLAYEVSRTENGDTRIIASPLIACDKSNKNDPVIAEMTDLVSRINPGLDAIKSNERGWEIDIPRSHCSAETIVKALKKHVAAISGKEDPAPYVRKPSIVDWWQRELPSPGRTCGKAPPSCQKPELGR